MSNDSDIQPTPIQAVAGRAIVGLTFVTFALVIAGGSFEYLPKRFLAGYFGGMTAFWAAVLASHYLYVEW